VRPFRSPLVPLPQLLGAGLLALAAFKIFPDPEIREDTYTYYGIFLAVAVGLSFLYNAFAYRSATSQFRRVPLEEVYRETTVIDEELGPPLEPGAPHLGPDGDR
jgi:hypothetical protein